MSVYLIFIVLAYCFCAVEAGEDRLKHFYHRIKRNDVTFCEDKTKILPDCTECIPGLQKGTGSDTCDEYIPGSQTIRNQIKDIMVTRFGKNGGSSRPFGLYPYLETKDFLFRQVTYGKMLSAPEAASHTLIDIGAYYNPINLFMTHGACFENIIIIEPVLDALSVFVPCLADPAKRTHIMFLPVTFAHYMKVSSTLPAPDTVVCVGCDSHFGPNRHMLETAFKRPYVLFFEFAAEYSANAPYLSMGSGLGEKITFEHNFQPVTNETEFTKRIMKVIQYGNV